MAASNSGPADQPATPVRGSGPNRAEIPGLFRRVDWLTFGLTLAAVWLVYFLTLAPELTLEDSGELVTGAFYAGIPHPPGYPVWTIYSWLWTVLLPVGNMAWRASVGEAFAAAFACGLLALLVSRGSSMLMEGISELKEMTGKWESAICVVSGFVAGVLMGLDGFMWRESVVVNRIALFSVPWLMLVLVFLLRWLYAPHQLRYAYWAALIFGICFTTHQSLITAALAFEVAIAVGNPRIGRDAFLGNFLIYAAYMINFAATHQHLFANLAKPGLFFLFNAVGIGSLAACIWLSVKTKGLFGQWKPVLIMALLWVLGVSFYFYMPVSGMTNPPMQWGYPRTVDGFFRALSRGQYEQPNPTNILADPGRFAGQLGMLFGGLANEFTWFLVFVALVPFAFFLKMQKRERAWLTTLGAMFLCLGVLLIILLNPTPDRASAELIRVFLTSSHTIVACLIGYGLALTAAYMATHYARFRRWGIGGGILALFLALVSLKETTATLFFGPAGTIPLLTVPRWVGQAFAKDQFGLPIFGSLLLVCIAVAFVCAVVIYRGRSPLLLTLVLFGALPGYSLLSHWHGSEQRGHWFGYWFGHDMFTPPGKDAAGKPLYPEMARNAVLYGGTDPGRFCPTYMIFCESFTPHDCQPVLDRQFDRRDVYIITQNALADGTYLNYIRAHYNRSQQKDPPFFSEFARTLLKDKEYETNILARTVMPLDRLALSWGDRVEKQRRTYTSWFSPKDFVLPAFADRLRPGPQQDALSRWLYEHLDDRTRELLGHAQNDKRLASRLAAALNRILNREVQAHRELELKQREKARLDQRVANGASSARVLLRQGALANEISELAKTEPLYTPARFQGVPLSEYLSDFIRQNPQSHSRVRLNRLLLEAAYPRELAKSIGGVYPDREIYIASPADNQRCYEEYNLDASRRLQHDQMFPNEPRQVKPGEGIRLIGNQIQISGTMAVMAINGLVAKIIFDNNPKTEFYVEESFPLDWMYPHLTPFGIIMKVNRQPLPRLTEDIYQRDHAFWKEYAVRMTGDVVDYDTPVKQLVGWIEKTYIHHNFSGFTGDRRFIRDADAQKSFSKLRSAIGGMYTWRLSTLCPPEYRPATQDEFDRLVKEADFAFRQALAFCPYSPEAVFRYSSLLMQMNRLDDAELVAQTCLKLDPYNRAVQDLLKTVRGMKGEQARAGQPPPAATATLEQLEQYYRQNASNFTLGLQLAALELQNRQTNRALELLDTILTNPTAGYEALFAVAQQYAALQNWRRLEVALERMVQLAPSSVESWYDLAAFKSSVGKLPEALTALKQSLALNAERLRTNPGTRNVLTNARADVRFTPLRQNPEFQKLVGAQ